MAKQGITFEQAMLRLEEIVRRLESGEESLDDSLKLFEEGTKLSAQCEKILQTAQQKVELLTEANPTGKDFCPDENCQ